MSEVRPWRKVTDKFREKYSSAFTFDDVDKFIDIYVNDVLNRFVETYEEYSFMDRESIIEVLRDASNSAGYGAAIFFSLLFFGFTVMVYTDMRKEKNPTFMLQFSLYFLCPVVAAACLYGFVISCYKVDRLNLLKRDVDDALDSAFFA